MPVAATFTFPLDEAQTTTLSDFAQLDTMERLLLRLGAWHFRFDPEVPYPVVVDEMVDLAHRFGSAQTPGYVNAVLDRSARAWQLPGHDSADH